RGRGRGRHALAPFLRPGNGARHLRRTREGRRMTRRRTAVALLVVAGALLVAGLAAAGTRSHNHLTGTSAVSGTVNFDGVWTATDATNFGKVIAAFHKVYPKVKVNYHPIGNNLPTVLATAIAGGHPPDMADIAQPGTLKQYAAQGKLKAITYD